MICKIMQLKLEAPHLAVIMALDVARICSLFKENVEVQVGQAEYRLRFQRQCVGEVWLALFQWGRGLPAGFST